MKLQVSVMFFVLFFATTRFSFGQHLENDSMANSIIAKCDIQFSLVGDFKEPKFVADPQFKNSDLIVGFQTGLMTDLGNLLAPLTNGQKIKALKARVYIRELGDDCLLYCVDPSFIESRESCELRVGKTLIVLADGDEYWIIQQPKNGFLFR